MTVGSKEPKNQAPFRSLLECHLLSEICLIDHLIYDSKPSLYPTTLYSLSLCSTLHYHHLSFLFLLLVYYLSLSCEKVTFVKAGALSGHCVEVSPAARTWSGTELSNTWIDLTEHRNSSPSAAQPSRWFSHWLLSIRNRWTSYSQAPPLSKVIKAEVGLIFKGYLLHILSQNTLPWS